LNGSALAQAIKVAARVSVLESLVGSLIVSEPATGSWFKSPPELKVIDSGTVNYTTQRITFAGNMQTRQWDVDKILDLNITDNGQTVMISVSNRKQPSGLQGLSYAEIGPGFYVRAATTMRSDGAQAAANEVISSAKIDELADSLRVELKQSSRQPGRLS
jgi:hypothetical protein